MFSKILIAMSALFIGTASGIAASATAVDTTRDQETGCYEMPTYKWDPETQSNVFVGYRTICR
ncbi:hypothetical protein [Breoghania sp.]|uniref:hypothetical protein n=1 Tax=Breoghania sp. TaxID=2065378 RepID=UPI002AA794AC|nr:hypothetical protein [Breoghania sp.]